MSEPDPFQGGPPPPVAPPTAAPIPVDDEPDPFSDPPADVPAFSPEPETDPDPFSDPPAGAPIDTGLTEPYAHFGGCADGGAEVECTSRPGTCQDPAKPFAVALTECRASDIVQEAHLCGDACVVGECGATRDAGRKTDCDLLSRKSTGVVTMYGACQEVYSNRITGCYYSWADCHHRDTSQERWIRADDLVTLLAEDADLRENYLPNGYCDCTDVRIGACRTNRGLVCATDKAQCGPTGVFISARTMLDQPHVYGTLDCRLCRPDAISSDMWASTNDYLEGKYVNLGVETSYDSSASLDEDIGTTGRMSLSEAGIIAGIVIGSVIGLLILICVGVCAYRCCNAEPVVAAKSTESTERVEDDVVVERGVDDVVPAVKHGVVS